MNARLFLMLLFVSLIACQSGSEDNISRLSRLKQTLEANPTPANRDSVIIAYRELLNQQPIDKEANAHYHNEIAKLQVQNKSFAEAIQTIMEGIRAYPRATGAAENVWTLGEIYENYLRNPAVVAIIKKLYAGRFANGTNLTAAREYMVKDTTKIAQNFVTLGSNMYDEKTHQVNFQAANDYIRACELYALVNAGDPKSAEYLHKAGETARAIRSFPKAIELYDWIYTKYPSFEKVAQALFLKAFTYDNDLGDKNIARALYKEFLEKYPNDDFADDTQFLLENLGKDDEEIIKGFSQQ